MHWRTKGNDVSASVTEYTESPASGPRFWSISATHLDMMSGTCKRWWKSSAVVALVVWVPAILVAMLSALCDARREKLVVTHT